MRRCSVITGYSCCRKLIQRHRRASSLNCGAQATDCEQASAGDQQVRQPAGAEAYSTLSAASTSSVTLIRQSPGRWLRRRWKWNCATWKMTSETKVTFFRHTLQISDEQNCECSKFQFCPQSFSQYKGFSGFCIFGSSLHLTNLSQFTTFGDYTISNYVHRLAQAFTAALG